MNLSRYSRKERSSVGVLLYRPAGRPTGRQIALGLGLSHGTCAYYTRRGRVPSEVAIRWGGTELAQADTGQTLNRADAIRVASSKLASFRRFREADCPIPRFTTSRDEARTWQENGSTVFGRTTEGFQGRGISVYQPVDTLGECPLFVEFIPNEREYRLHVVRGVVVSVQRKYLERPHLSDGGFVKNHAHGYVFKTPQRGLNGSRHAAAVAAVESLGLDFGAVDMVVDENGKEYVLEVNTAPALSPKRVQQYLEALRPLLQAQ